MTRQEATQPGQTSSIRKVAFASLIGTSIEWYDFFIYGLAAALVFGPQFFPAFSGVAGVLAAFAAFAVGFIARPLGSILAGHFGDRVGRKVMLVLSLSLMGGATFLIGLLPSYAQIGVWAPVLLVTLRVIQGLSAGAEWGGAALMTVEHAPSAKRGFYGNFVQIGVPTGIILANLIFLASTGGLSEEQFAAWGWRIPFLLSIVLVAVGLFVRLRIMESPVFATLKETGRQSRWPVLEVVRHQYREVLLAGGAAMANSAIGYLVLVYSLSYGTDVLGMNRNTLLAIVLIASVIQVLLMMFFAALSDRIGRRNVFLGGAVFSVLWAVPFAALLSTASPVLIFLTVIVMLLGGGAMYSVQAALFAELFSTRVRYSGASLGYQLGVILGGGLAPFIATALFAATGTVFSISAYLIVLAVIALVSIIAIGETSKRDIAGMDRETTSGADPEGSVTPSG